MLRLIVRSVVTGEDIKLPDEYHTFDVISEELEKYLRQSRLVDLHIGFELRETQPKEKKEEKPEPGSLAERLAKMKAAKGNSTGNQSNSNGQSKQDKWKEKAKAALKKQEAIEAKGYNSKKKRRLFGLMRPAAN